MSQLGDKFLAASGATSKKFRIDQDVQKLMIVRTFNSGDAAVPSLFYGRVLSALPERVSLEIQGLGSSRLSQGERIPLGKMAAFAQFGEGVIPEIFNVTTGIVRQYIPVVLGRVGVGLTAGDNSYLLLENCTPNITYTVYAIQTPTTGNLVYEYLEQSVLAGDKHRKISVASVTNVVLPVAGLQKLVVTYNGGRSCEYLPEELQFINAEGNDIEILTRSFIQGNLAQPTDYPSGAMSSEAIVLETLSVSQIEVYTDGNLYEYLTVGEINRDAR